MQRRVATWGYISPAEAGWSPAGLAVTDSLALDAAMMNGGLPAGLARYERLKEEFPPSAFDERLFSEIAERLQRIGFAADAIRLLELNAREYPESWRVHDALGDAYADAGRRDEAIDTYERALQMTPDPYAIRQKLAALREP